jgi:Chaperone of endosialidase
MKTSLPPVLITFALVCFALVQNTQAVSPAPDGGYSGANTAEGGSGALFSLTTGTNNTALGSQALFSLTTGVQNTAVGAQALKSNTADRNTAIGFQALVSNTTTDDNTAVGWRALFKNTTGFDNTAMGSQALYRNINGAFNSAFGWSALISNTGGHYNTATGSGALSSNTTGFDNTATGSALPVNTTGAFNTATGVSAMYSSITGDSNTAIGFDSLEGNTTGSNNTALGVGAGNNVRTANNVTCIGWHVRGDDVSNTTWIGNIYGVTTQSGITAPVVVSDGGQLGTVASSKRFKKDIATMDKASEAIMSLRPVTFHYKSDTKDTPQFGLIAEEVAKVNPTLVLPDEDGKPYTVRYDAVNAMLLNEFLKEHRKVEEQEATIAELKKNFQANVARQQKQIEALTAGLQKVSAQVEVSKPAPQTVLNSQ